MIKLEYRVHPGEIRQVEVVNPLELNPAAFVQKLWFLSLISARFEIDSAIWKPMFVRLL